MNPPERRSHNYISHGTTTLFAALDTATGKVIGECHRRRRAKEFRKFPDTIDKAVPANLDVNMTMDNYGTHKTVIIRNWFARRRGFMHTSRRPVPRGSTVSNDLLLLSRTSGSAAAFTAVSGNSNPQFGITSIP